MVLAALVIFSISTFSPVGNGDRLGIAIIQIKEKTHQLLGLLNQQITVLVGLDISPNWVREQSAVDSLIYGTVKSDDVVPAGINEDYGYLATSNRDRGISLSFKADKKEVTIKYANYGEKLHTETVPLSRSVEQSCRIKRQRQQVNKYVNALRTEWLIGHRKSGL